MGNLIQVVHSPVLLEPAETIVTDLFSGPARAIDPVCVSVCVRSITFEQNNHWPSYLARWFISTLYSSSSKVSVICQRSRSQKEMLPRWSVRPWVRAFWLQVALFWWRVACWFQVRGQWASFYGGYTRVLYDMDDGATGIAYSCHRCKLPVWNQFTCQILQVKINNAHKTFSSDNQTLVSCASYSMLG